MRLKSWHIILVAGVALGAIHIPLFASAYRGEIFNPEKAGWFGDFTGGYVGTIFLILSVALIALQLRHQFEAHERSAFESRFFELLKFHRENVSEIGIGSEYIGRRVFVSMIRELREVMEIVEEASKNLGEDFSDQTKLEVGYLGFYYGVGPNSSKLLEDVLSKHPPGLALAVRIRMEERQERYRVVQNQIHHPATGLKERGQLEAQLGELTRLPFRPFDGHQSRLAHYFRHLFHLVRYIDEHAPGKDMSKRSAGEPEPTPLKNGPREYADILRAQLTNHEQALLCVNALSPLGRRWRSEGYITKYELIKNVPKSFFHKNPKIELKKEFSKIVFEFERHEGGANLESGDEEEP